MASETAEAIIVFITAATREEAGRLAEMMVARQLAACVQILGGIESIYRWQHKIEHQQEVLLIAKTLDSKFAELEREVCALHSYEVPEIVALPLSDGSSQYLQWLQASVKKTV